MSHRTQVILDDWQYEKILERVRRDGKSMGEMVREAVTEYLSPARATADERDPIFDVIGIGRGDGSCGSEDHDFYLYGGSRETDGESVRGHQRLVRARRRGGPEPSRR